MSQSLDRSLPSVNGYILTEQIYAGNRTAIYRARVAEEPGVGASSLASGAQGRSVVIKLLRSPHPHFNDLVRFRNQFIIARRLSAQSIVPALALLPWKHSYALVMEDVGGISLRHYLARQGELTVAQTLAIALQLAGVLHHLSQHRVVHKDINPANVLIHPDTQQVWLIDFSLASLLPKETLEIQPPHHLEGTLAYIAPEQTGRMNRAIDYRTDFYSLGVMLYELLTSQLPFQSNDPMELIHCHIAKVPVPPCDVQRPKSNIPKPLSDIVLKLMAKKAENRYQSALGLAHDLQQCLDQWQQPGHIVEFELGQRDLSDRFVISEKLYGRHVEVHTLLDAFERVSQGTSELILIAGFSGIGKTAVVNEVHKPIVRQRGYFIKGKYDQLNRNRPLAAFVQAFRSLMGQLLGESDVALATWKTNILEAVGDSGQVLIEVIPELERIIGPQSAVPKLSGNAAQNRFNLLFNKFIRVFTTPDHPLVIFLDDLQWVDSASLNLFRQLMDDESGYLLVLGAYRDNEVFAAHPLMLTLTELDQQETTITTLTLPPLHQRLIQQWVADTLGCSLALASPLAQLVYQKTNGNPFFTTQFLQALHRDRHIVFNRDMGYWQCELTQVRQLALTDDVVTFMVERLQQLPKVSQDVLKIAACLGNQFDLGTLALVCQRPQEEVANHLWPSLQTGLLIPKNETYKLFQQDSHPNNALAPPKDGVLDNTSADPLSVTYRFLHDRVQQAAYALIPETEKQHTHWKIGQWLRQAINPQENPDQIFTLVNHLNYGMDAVVSATERQQLASLNLLACQQAQLNTAFLAARQYAKTGQMFLAHIPWETAYDLKLQLYNALAELNHLCGDFDAMDRAIDQILHHARTLLDKITAYRIKLQGCFSQGVPKDGIALGIQVLEQLGVHVPTQPSDRDIQSFIQRVIDCTHSQDIEALSQLATVSQPEKRAIVNIASNILGATYIAQPSLFPIVACLLVEQSVQYGSNSASAQAYGSYGVIACTVMRDIDTGVVFGRLAAKLDLSGKIRSNQGRGLTLKGGFTEFRQTHLKDTLELLATGYRMSLEVGDHEFVGHNANLYCSNGFWSGRSLPLLEQESRAYVTTLIKFNQPITAAYAQIIWQASLNLLEETVLEEAVLEESGRPWVLSGEVMEEVVVYERFKQKQDVAGCFFIHLFKIFLGIVFDQLDVVNHYQADFDQYLSSVSGLIVEAEYYFYDSLALLLPLAGPIPDEDDEGTASSDRRATEDMPEDGVISALIEKVNQNQSQLQTDWANYAPMNYQHKVDLVEAETHRVLGHPLKAMSLYDRAIAGAKANEYIQEEALANERAAKFYLRWGKHTIAAAYLQNAYYCYARWGAKAKTNDLEQHHASLLNSMAPSPQNRLNPLVTMEKMGVAKISKQSTSKSSESTRINQEKFDFVAVLKAAQALTDTINLDELLHHLSQVVLQQSGGDRLILVLPNASMPPDLSSTWEITLVADPESTIRCAEPLDQPTNAPVKLIQYVKRTREIFLADTLNIDVPVVDDYLLTQHPQSFLCAPLLYQEQLIGILYVHSSTRQTLSVPDRVTILNFLLSQVAIALHNAHLYEDAALKSRVIEASVDGMGIFEDGRYIYLNKSHLALFGYKPEELIGKSWEVLYASEQVQWFYETAFPVLNQTGQWSGTTIALRKDGSTFDQEVSLYSLADGKIICICRDISQRVRLEAARQHAEEERQQSLVQLQVSNEELESFAYSVAHDLQSPLRAINGYSQALLEDYGNLIAEEGQDFLNRIRANTVRMGHLIDDLLRLSQITRSKLSYGTVNISALSQRILTDLNASDPHHSAEITIASDMWAEADPSLIEVVLRNLLDNAWKFSRDRTPARIEVGTLPFDAIPTPIPESVYDYRESSSSIFFVRDNGVGFDMDYAHKLFGIFQRLHGIEEFPGTGIGLVIVKRVIQRHGGRVWATSELNQGATFFFTVSPA